MTLKQKILKQLGMKKFPNETIVQIRLAHPKSHLNEMRRAFGVPKKYTDERLLEVLVGYVIDQYMSVENIDAEMLQDYITDGVIKERWL